MKIYYRKERLRNNITFGILEILVGLFGLLFIEHNTFLSWGWIIIGLAQAGIGFFEFKKQYLTIDQYSITKHSLNPKTVLIEDINKIRKFSNSYKIETDNETLTIDKGIVENKSLIRLSEIIDNIKITDFKPS